ncbi:MAG: zf-HC2 domain-containing protein [Oscillospiraceae bacterium]|nr:zf-HC2 domain-containing protein [Oscillospiraceae bacterium]
MRYDLPCEIVQDLLPNYVEGLTGENTAESVRTHLEDCESCRAQWEAMKAPYQEPKAENGDGKLLQKIKKRLNRRVVAVSAAVALVLAAALWAATQAPLRPVPVEELRISAEVYDLKQQAQLAAAGNGESVVIRAGEGEEVEYTVTIPEYSVNFLCSDELMEQNQYVAVYRISSPYQLRRLKTEIREEGGRQILYLSEAKTALLFGKFSTGRYEEVSLSFGTLDEVVYQSPDGTQTVLWTPKTAQPGA